MKYLGGLLLWQVTFTTGFIVPASKSQAVWSQTTDFSKGGSYCLFSSTQDDEEKAEVIKATSFAEAGKSILDEQDQERMEAMGDFDSNPSFQNADLDRIREAIRVRAAAVGAEKDDNKRYLEEMKQRAISARENRQQPGQLDLSQISTGDEPRRGKKSDWDESLPTMMYDPADELTEKEQAEADPTGQLSIWEQALTEMRASKWPNFGTVVREVAVMSVVVAVTGAIIINADSILRDVYTNMGMLPRKEDIPGQLEDLDLPQGFTNNMNEDDLAKITEEMNAVGQKTGLSSQSLEGLLESQNPDL